MNPMDNNNVVDFFTRKSLNQVVRLDSEASDKAINSLGRYLGVLRAEDGEYVRHMTTQLAHKRAQIDALIEQWQYLYSEYAQFMSAMLVFLKVGEDQINTSEDDIYVDAKGHVWAIKERDKEAFMKAIKKD